MDRDQEKIDFFSRRSFIIGGLQALGMSALVGRLAWLQLVEGDKYRTLAENNRINVRILPPSRGQIVDRFGVPLATNLQNFQVLVTPEQTEDVEETLENLQKILPLNERIKQRVLKKLKQNPSYVPIEIRDNLAWEDVSKIELNMPHLPGISVQAGELRSYPYKDSTAHIIGYVGRVSEADHLKDPLLALPGFLVGKTAIEKTYDLPLRGKAGKAEMEVNVHGRPVRELSRTPAQSGKRLVLSIDAEYQRFVQQRLATERSASAVVMDVHTGEVYACASHPSFDPNAFSGGISVADWEQMRDDPAQPLNNKAVGGQYPPGSTFKIVTALAGLESGLIDQNWTVFCPGHYDLGNMRFHCWKSGGHGTVNLNGALAHSCDTYFYKLSTIIGIDRIADMARTLGLGDVYGFDLGEERAGLIPDIAWKRKVKKDIWHQGETLNSAIGQGDVLSTPLQLATMLARVVNGGYKVTPWIAARDEGAGGEPSESSESPESLESSKSAESSGLSGLIGTRPKPFLAQLGASDIELGIDAKHLRAVMNGLEAVCQQGGTAYASRIVEDNMAMGGKTGTSQVKRISKAERASGVRRQEDLPWHLRHHALFVGYAPVQSPRYACCVLVDHGAGGSTAAAPIARDIMLEIQKRDPKNKSNQDTSPQNSGLQQPIGQNPAPQNPITQNSVGQDSNRQDYNAQDSTGQDSIRQDSPE